MTPNPYDKRNVSVVYMGNEYPEANTLNASGQAWQDGYDGLPLPVCPNDIACDPPMKKGSPVHPTSVMANIWRAGVNAKLQDIAEENEKLLNN